MIRKTFLNSQISTKSTTNDSHCSGTFGVFCYLSNSRWHCKKQSSTGGACPEEGPAPLPLSPPWCLLRVEHSILQLRRELDKNILTEKPRGFVWISGTEQRRMQEMGSEEAGAGNRTVQWLDQIKAHCETAPQRQCAHTGTPQSCHPNIPNGYDKSRPWENGHRHSQMLSS